MAVVLYASKVSGDRVLPLLLVSRAPLLLPRV
jgi:hypothetical protein